MLRALCFYGAAGGALTFLDPVTGTAVTQVPVVGAKDTVAMRGAIAYTDTPAKREFVNVKIGSEGDYHDIQLIPKSDGDNLTADLGDIDITPLGDFIVKENSAISGTAAASGLSSGVIYFEDGEPEIPIPKGRRVFLTSIPSGDQATTLAVTNMTQPNASKALAVDSMYYVVACTVLPEDKLIQAFILKSSSGQCAVAPPKGRVVYPSCPMKFDGNEKLAVLVQVQAATEATAIWELVEVPKTEESIGAGTATEEGLSSGGSIAPMGIQAGVGASIKFGKFR